ncbi:MAG: sensor histidine kinase [Desulforhopalus sp.]
MNSTYLDALITQVFHCAPTPIFIVREDGRLLLFNQITRNILGIRDVKTTSFDTWFTCLTPYPAADFKINSSSFFKPDITPHTLPVSVKTPKGESLIWYLYNVPLGRDANGQRTILSIAQDMSVKNKEKDSATHTHQVEHLISTRTKNLNDIIATLEEEIIEKKSISDALTLSRERLKKISRHTLDILEADRRNISKELHDSIGASLAAIKFSLEEKEISRIENNNQLTCSLIQEVNYLAAAIKETKRISANLRPSILDELGLAATISWYIRQFQHLYGDIRIHYSTEVSEHDVPEAMKINIYRIIQEGLTNAERHSQAATIRLSMKYCDGKHSLSLSIEDDGCGFNVREIQSNKDPLGGYGLIAMRERCEIFGGFFHLDSSIGKGTRINAILPLK